MFMFFSNDAHKDFINNLPDFPLKTFIIKLSSVALLGTVAMFIIATIIDTYFKNSVISSVLDRFPESAVYIPSIIIGFFIIYNADLSEILIKLRPKVTLKSKRLFWGIIVLDLIITIIFELI